MNVVEVQDLTKDYPLGRPGKKKRALDGVSFQVEEGQIFGLIGPNGAGKSTTLKLLMGLVSPTGGTMRILGRPVDDLTVKARIGFLPENPHFYDYLTGWELLDYFGRLFGLGRAERRRRIDVLLAKVGLLDAAELQLRKYSKGMTQRLGIAQALVNEPSIVFLDEPMSGLDPMGRRDMTLIVRELRERGVTVVFSSHILPDVEALCDRVAILHRGRIVQEGRLDEILKVSVRAVEVVVENLPARAEERLPESTRNLRRLGSTVRFELPEPEALGAVLDLVRTNGARLSSVQPIKETLEEHFFRRVEDDESGRG